MRRSELTAYMREFRFLMWRLEFTDEADAGVNFIEFLKANRYRLFFSVKR